MYGYENLSLEEGATADKADNAGGNYMILDAVDGHSTRVET